MSAAAARRSGAPSLSVRALALALAALICAGAIALLALGFSLRAIEAFRQSPMLVDLIPAPVPPPPPEPLRPQPRAPLHDMRAAPEPAPRAPGPPPTVADATIVPSAAPAPAPAPVAADGSGVAGVGTGAGGGNGAGAGGSGSGGRGLPVFRPASWAVVPGTPELEPFNPPLARQRSVNGTVLLSCHVLRSRRLADCRVVRERPRGYGFGQAGLNASRTFLVDPPMRGEAVLENEWVEIPIAFNNRRPR